MRLAILYSGGKDSNLALHKAKEHGEVVCLVTIESLNPESFMFHTPAISLTDMQAKALGLPLIKKTTKGEKEKELADLQIALVEAKTKFNVEGVVTGAVESVYQASRIEKICHDLGLWCFNPLWKMDQLSLLDELLKLNFEVLIVGVFAHPLDSAFIGKRLDKDMIDKLSKLKDQFSISPSGEGGEIETVVLDCPNFKKKISITESITLWDGSSGKLEIIEADLIQK